ncbi:MAG TPA: hypothetical protein DD381_04430 [Lentisphaeria bacterium]|nr:MAG: hypothetical protein A2X47_07220 [Lentisphaerae bacterium GWF2_38_69]HBM15579.1 hypothetical protein [Lentisphaeria bacterium]
MKTDTLIKVCGIRFIESAIYAVSEGADFIGLVFHPNSKRFVDIASAKKITEAVSFNGGIPVAVVVDHKASDIKKICRKTGINHVQFHGKNAIEALPEIPEDIIKILSVKVSDKGIPESIPSDILKCLDPHKDYLLYDGQNPGSGVRFDLDFFCPLLDFRYFVAGGLNPFNVAEVLKALKPYAVDVSSGVETEPGVKDPLKIKEFIQQVKHFKG